MKTHLPSSITQKNYSHMRNHSMEDKKVPKDSLKEKITDVEKIAAELKLAQQKMEEYMNGWKRAKADYLNLKRESEKKEQELVQFANAGLILQLLPVYDNFKLAWKHIPNEQVKVEWVIGIEHIKKQFGDILKNLGIEEIKTVGESFNPELHEAVAKEKKDGFTADVVFEEVKSGYTLYGKVLEPAKVKVAA